MFDPNRIHPMPMQKHSYASKKKKHPSTLTHRFDTFTYYKLKIFFKEKKTLNHSEKVITLRKRKKKETIYLFFT